MTPVILAFFFASSSPYAEIRVVDQSGRGVPLVELETVNHQIFVTDNAGRVAFHEPGLMGSEVFFHVRSHGYEVKKDGFGIGGAKVTPVANRTVEIRVKCTQLAERMCRLTGEGLYRDSQLLGYPAPQFHPGVAGQDSVQTAMYKGRRIWLWGDTNRMSYPLGHYRTAGAWSSPFDKTFDPSHGINFDYVRDKGNIKAMMPMKEHPEGVVWLDGLCTVKDENNEDKLVAHYSRRKGLAEQLEHGIAVYDDDKGVFESAKVLKADDWRHPHGHAIPPEDLIKDPQDKFKDVKYIAFGNPFTNVRVPASLQAILDPNQYESFTMLSKNGQPGIDWQWQRMLPPGDPKQEDLWHRSLQIKSIKPRYLPKDAADELKTIQMYNGTVRWNNYRKCWIMLAGQIGGSTSHLGEVWYSEATESTGPFTKAVKVATHNKQTFYNVCHHPFLDQDDGRTIFFEGTYTEEFSGSHHFTPRYDYNQVLYKLVLSSPELLPARVR